MEDNAQTPKPIESTLTAVPEIVSSLPNPQITSPKPESPKKPQELKTRNIKKTIKRVLIGIVVPLLVVTGVYAFAMITSLDTAIFKVTLSGIVMDHENNFVSDANITLSNGSSTTTNENGVFFISDLVPETVTVTIKADGYEEFVTEYTISRGFLNYKAFVTFKVQSASASSLSGKFIPTNISHTFVDDKIIINETEYPISTDGSFNISDLESGTIIFQYLSVDYEDFERSISLEAGNNSIEDITLVSAGDIIGEAISWIREDLLLDLTITVEGVNESMISIDGSGDFRVKDLEVGKEYTLRTQLEGYSTRDYQITIEQGENEIFDFKVVEEGRLPFLRKVDGKLQVISSKLDGYDEKQHTTESNTRPYAEYIEDNLIYFLSGRDRHTTRYGGLSVLPYVANAEEGEMQRIFDVEAYNVNELGRVIPNFTAKLLANVTKGEESRSRKLELMNLEATEVTQVEYITAEDGVFNDIVISDDGNIIYYYMQDSAEEINGLWRWNRVLGTSEKIMDKPNLMIYTVTTDGNKVLYSATNDRTGLTDLSLYTYDIKQDAVLREAAKGSQYHFLKNSDNLVVFHELKEGGNNVYLLNINENSETKLTNFGNLEGVDAVYQQSGYVIYQTNLGMYILDPLDPHSGKLVTKNFERYTGYDF